MPCLIVTKSCRSSLLLPRDVFCCWKKVHTNRNTHSGIVFNLPLPVRRLIDLWFSCWGLWKEVGPSERMAWVSRGASSAVVCILIPEPTYRSLLQPSLQDCSLFVPRSPWSVSSLAVTADTRSLWLLEGENLLKVFHETSILDWIETCSEQLAEA